MVTEDLKIDELILQVFEEHEETFFWPVTSQKEAKNFVRFLHEKGAPYGDLCKEIGEFEHNFSAWRKGLGRVGIGTRMIERINRTVEEVIESDDDEDHEHNLKLLAKVNKKNQTKVNEKPSTGEVKDAKKQKEDITSSMMKNIDKVSAKIEQTKESKDVQPQKETPKPVPPKKDYVDTKKEVQKKEVVSTKTETTLDKKVVKEDQIKDEKTTKVESKPVEEKPKKVEVKAEPKVEPSKPLKVEKEDKRQSPEKSEETQTVKKEDPEVDEVKRKMDAIKKKVEMMKKAKAEQAAAAMANQQATTNGDSTNQPVQNNEAGEKYEAMKRRLSELRSKLMEDDTNVVGSSSQKETQKEQKDNSDQEPKEDLSIPSAEKSKTAPLVAEEDDQSSSSADTSSSDLEDNVTDNLAFYDSDLDPDNYDSDLEYELNKEVKKLASDINSTRSKVRSTDGPGHVYIFSDSPSNDREHRVKIGASKCPEKRFAEARKYNIALKQVSSVPVKRRNSALSSVHKSLSGLRIGEEKDWFKGPIDTILQKVSKATEHYGTGPSLVTFDSQC